MTDENAALGDAAREQGKTTNAGSDLVVSASHNITRAAERQHRKIPVCRADGKVVGDVRGDTFYKTLSASRHFLRMPPSIGFDMDTLNAAERNGARIVQVTDKDSGKIYRALIYTIRRRGFTVNRGYGLQLALRLKFWSLNGAPLVEESPAVRQLSFRGMV